MKKKKSLGSTILVILGAILVWFLKQQGILDDNGSVKGLGSSESSSAHSVNGEELSLASCSDVGFTPVKRPGGRPGGDWELLKECRLVTGRNGDGDSFHVKHEKGETEFRLYFIDTPESQYKTYRGGESNGPRIAEQGAYFGGIGQDQTTAVGLAAKGMVKRILAENPFEILTKWEDVYGPDRKYCLAIVQWQGREVYLHELLVAQGLGRIHTRGAGLPSGRSYHEQKSFLQTLEARAREEKVGAWGL